MIVHAGPLAIDFLKSKVPSLAQVHCHAPQVEAPFSLVTEALVTNLRGGGERDRRSTS